MTCYTTTSFTDTSLAESSKLQCGSQPPSRLAPCSLAPPWPIRPRQTALRQMALRQTDLLRMALVLALALALSSLLSRSAPPPPPTRRQRSTCPAQDLAQDPSRPLRTPTALSGCFRTPLRRLRLRLLVLDRMTRSSPDLSVTTSLLLLDLPLLGLILLHPITLSRCARMPSRRRLLVLTLLVPSTLSTVFRCVRMLHRRRLLVMVPIALTLLVLSTLSTVSRCARRNLTSSERVTLSGRARTIQSRSKFTITKAKQQ